MRRGLYEEPFRGRDAVMAFKRKVMRCPLLYHWLRALAPQGPRTSDTRGAPAADVTLARRLACKCPTSNS